MRDARDGFAELQLCPRQSCSRVVFTNMHDLEKKRSSLRAYDGTLVRCARCSKMNRITSRVFDEAARCGHCHTQLRQPRIILCDVSGSMSEPAGDRQKIDVLREALSDILRDLEDCTILAFASHIKLVAQLSQLPTPAGGTALHLALRALAQLDPQAILVISDGYPDSPDLAFSAAARLSGRIDVIYIGPDDDATAKAFMLALAKSHGGTVVEQDVTRAENSAQQLSEDVRRLMKNRT